MAAEQHTQKHFTASVPAPSKLDMHGQVETEWKRFHRQWKHYVIATRLDKEEKAYQSAVLLACVGAEAQEIFESLPFSGAEDRTDIDTVIKKFEEFCMGETHEVYESYKFHRRNQEKEENIDTYVTVLRKLAKSCNFQEEDRMIRDRIVIGVYDDTVREKLLEDKDLTLKKATKICRAHETSKTQTQAMSGASQDSAVNRLKYTLQRRGGAPKRGGFRPHSDGPHHQSAAKNALVKCTRCGKSPGHGRASCPAKDAECRKCHKKGHYAAECRSKREVGNIAEEEEEGGLLGSVRAESSSNHVNGVDASWHVDIQVTTSARSCAVKFRLDTGADVTVVPASYFKKNSPLIKQPDKTLYGPGHTELKVVGKVSAVLSTSSASSEQDLFLIEDLKEPLLGSPAIKALQLIGINAVHEKKENYRESHPKLFDGLGKMKTSKYTIRLEDNAQPYAIATPRRLSLPMKKRVQEELQRLEDADIIRPITTPTDWCAPIVVVPKSNGKIRLCIDFTKLNESVKRENYPLPTTDQLLAQLDGATLFTKLDCVNGFHQIELDEKSQELTTFITPFGRYCYKRMPFGISSGPEVFHREMSHLLSGIQGVIVDIDDVLVCGRNQQEHDTRVKAVLAKMQDAGITLNDKCVFSTDKVKFLGHIITPEGIHIDDEKVKVITNFPRPENISDLRRLLGMVNHVGKFAPNLSDTTKPLRDLLKKETEWTWDTPQEQAFEKIKEQLSTAPVLAHYSPEKPTKVSADASSYGIGGVLLQREGTDWKPVFYASRSLSETEKRYAQVEKESLAVTWCCEKFADYLIGMHRFTIETDHKPLLALLKSKQLDELTPRIQRFRMRLLRFSYDIMYTAGKDLMTADTLSRAPGPCPATQVEQEEVETNHHVCAVLEALPASDTKMEEIRQEQLKDGVCSQVMNFCKLDHWPGNAKKDPDLRPFWLVRHDLAVLDGILLFQCRLVIPPALQTDILHRLHQGHQGIVKCRALARGCVWWPGLATHIEEMVSKCDICEKERRYPPQPMKPTKTPDYPWQRVGMDLFELSGKTYLIIIDYYSRWIEVVHLQNTSSSSVIDHCKSVFARFGIPEIVVSDNGPQFSSKDFLNFSKYYDFTHVTSSPYHPQGNGEAERAVGTVKNLLKKADDPYLALLQYRSTPLQHGASPAELLMSRKLRSRVPTLSSNLTPYQQDTDQFQKIDTQLRTQQKKNFDTRHRAKELPPMKEDQPVWAGPKNSEAVVMKPQSTPMSPRSVVIKTDRQGVQRRNRHHLRRRGLKTPPAQPAHPQATSTLPDVVTPTEPEPASPPIECPEPQQVPSRAAADMKTSRSGRPIKIPDRLNL